MNKILAIKTVRDKCTGVSLLDAKRLVEEITPMLQMSPQDRYTRLESVKTQLSGFDLRNLQLSDITEIERLIRERDFLASL